MTAHAVRPPPPYEPIAGVPHRGLHLSHPSNPVVFLDVRHPVRHASGPETLSAPPTRIAIELFHDLAPVLVNNYYHLCIGSVTRRVQHCAQPTGYKDTVFTDALPGQHVTGGDVLGHSDGQGYWSATGSRNGPLPVPQTEVEALCKHGAARCTGHLRVGYIYWNVNREAPSVAGVAVNKMVASTFRIDVRMQRAESATDRQQQALATFEGEGIVIGRVVTRSPEETTAVVRELEEVAKVVYRRKREAGESTENPAQTLPVLVVALCGSQKKHAQSFTSLRHHAALQNHRLHHRMTEEGGPSSINTRSRDSSSIPLSGRVSLLPEFTDYLFRFLQLDYDERSQKMILSPYPNHTGGDTEDPLSQEKEAVPEEVCVVLHKVATFGSRNAARALSKWCRSVKKRRAHLHLPPLVVVDELNKTQLLATRSMLCRLLDGPTENGKPLALIPRSFMWERTAGESPEGGLQVTPLGINSFVLLNEKELEKSRVSGRSGEKWWIVKPDESTGLAYTHHLVIWKSEVAEVRVPAAVQERLPVETDVFVIQEFYPYALPIVLKVYCIGDCLHITVKSTEELLKRVYTQVDTGGCDVPVFLDSQDSSLFEATGVEGAAGVPQSYWDNFFSVGTPAYTAIAGLASALSDDAVLGLSLFGFDVLLVPEHLAHHHQVKSFRGVGYMEGATVSYSHLSVSPHGGTLAKSNSASMLRGSTSTDVIKESDPPMYNTSFFFDRQTGAPTPLLMHSRAVIVDVNYFPGFKGIHTANEAILEMMVRKYGGEPIRMPFGNGTRSRGMSMSQSQVERDCIPSKCVAM